jgi:flagellar hook assembly protein FlgD
MKKLAIFCVSLIALPALLAGCAEQTAQPLFPDPYVTSEGHTDITFTDLASSCTIEIYTLERELVRTISETDGDGQAVWDVRNEKGEAVGSGVYLYVIKSSQDSKKGKLIITK